MPSLYRLAGGVLLVAGTTIGAGMLALPVMTGFAGFLPSLLLFIGYWAYMTYTALLILEVNLAMEPHVNLITMARRTLGPVGVACSWIVYLFLLYSLTTAYIAGGGSIVVDGVAAFMNYTIPFWVGTIPLLLIFGFFVYRGMRSVDYVNRLLMIGLAISYIIIIAMLTPHVSEKLLFHVDWKKITLAVSIVATSFGYHIVIPSLTTYLNRDVKSLCKVIIIGSIIPLVVYILWEFLTLGIIPIEGSYGLKQGYEQGSNGVHLLTGILGHSAISMIAQFFSFFAIVTSFLGVSLSLSDFLADGFKIQKTPAGRFFIILLTFVPPLAIALTDPRAFLVALEYAGAFGVIILLGLIPALMVWSRRYWRAMPSDYQAPGGRWALIAVAAIALLIICIEISNKLMH